MKHITRLIALLVALASSLASAQPKECLPLNQWGDASKQGGVLMQGRDNTIKGDWYAVWCPSDTLDANGQRVWYLMRYGAPDSLRPPGTREAVDAAIKLWQSETAETSFRSTADLLGALWNAPGTLQLTKGIMSAALSADPVASLRSLIIVPPPPSGTKAYDDIQQLRHQACQQGAVLPPWPPASGVTYPLPAASAIITCVQPKPTYVAPTTQYVVTSTAVYPLRADGTRAPTALPQRATLGQACDCAKRLILGLYGARYCDVTIPTVTQPVVAGCTAR